MDPRTGQIFEKPANMSTAEWEAECKARGLIPMTQADFEALQRKADAQLEAAKSARAKAVRLGKRNLPPSPEARREKAEREKRKKELNRDANRQARAARKRNRRSR